MSDEQGPKTLYEVRRVGTFLLIVTGFVYLLILENAPPENVGLLLALVGGAFIAALVGMSVFIHQGGTVFGYAGSYPTVPGVIFGIGSYWLATTDASSLQVTLLASGGLLAMLAAGGLALYSAHRQ